MVVVGGSTSRSSPVALVRATRAGLLVACPGRITLGALGSPVFAMAALRLREPQRTLLVATDVRGLRRRHDVDNG